MEKNRTQRARGIGRHLRAIAFASFLAALSIVCGKYLAIPVGTVLRFSLENLPILLCGMVLGPAMGALTGAVADLVGCLMVGYVINPVVTLGAVAIGLCGGLVYRFLKNVAPFGRISIAVLLSHLIGSVVIKTFGLAVFFDMPFYALMLWRLLNYAIVGLVELLALYSLLRNKSVRRQLEHLR